MFGKDSFAPDEYPYYWRVFETEDEYFDYYRNYHAFWQLYGMGLPDDVLAQPVATSATAATSAPAPIRRERNEFTGWIRSCAG